MGLFVADKELKGVGSMPTTRMASDPPELWD